MERLGGLPLILPSLATLQLLLENVVSRGCIPGKGNQTDSFRLYLVPQGHHMQHGNHMQEVDT